MDKNYSNDNYNLVYIVHNDNYKLHLLRRTFWNHVVFNFAADHPRCR